MAIGGNLGSGLQHMLGAGEVSKDKTLVEAVPNTLRLHIKDNVVVFS